MEFNLSNCATSSASSATATLVVDPPAPRGRPPPKVYGDEFFEDLAHFLPHLDVVQLSAASPMATENYRAWELIAEVAPDLPVQVVTNALQWNKRSRPSSRRCGSPTFSIDGITAETSTRPSDSAPTTTPSPQRRPLAA